MKYSLILATALFAFSCTAEAKYNPPENYVTNAQREALQQINLYDQDGDGRLDVEEFEKKKNAKVTRNTRRQIRQAKKAGSYQVPSEQFKTIDANQDGYITYPELEKYISEQTRKTKGKVQYY